VKASWRCAAVRQLLAAAVKLYELGELSSGAAAALAGLPRVVFLAKLADFGVDTFRLNESDLLRESRLPREIENQLPPCGSAQFFRLRMQSNDANGHFTELA
jgi:predicted HTH domain antitoxin